MEEEERRAEAAFPEGKWEQALSRPPERAERFGVPGGHKVLYGPQRAGKWGQVNTVDNGGPFSSSKGSGLSFMS